MRNLGQYTNDIIFFIGCGLLGAGLWMFKPWVSLSVLGALFLFIVIYSGVRGGAKNGRNR